MKQHPDWNETQIRETSFEKVFGFFCPSYGRPQLIHALYTLPLIGNDMMRKRKEGLEAAED